MPTVFSALSGLAARASRLELPACARHEYRRGAVAGDLAICAIFPNALIFAMYGLTECKRVSYLEPELLDARPTSVGKAIPGTEAVVLVDGRPAEPGEVGHPPRPRAARDGRLLEPARADGRDARAGPDARRDDALHPGPFTVDEDGFLYFVGRTDDIIKVAGQKVSPVEVENAL